MKNYQKIIADIEGSNLHASRKKDLKSIMDEKYINSFHSSIYPEGLLSCIESHYPKNYQLRINAFFKLYPDH